jgi:hypothetical protein
MQLLAANAYIDFPDLDDRMSLPPFGCFLLESAHNTGLRDLYPSACEDTSYYIKTLRYLTIQLIKLIFRQFIFSQFTIHSQKKKTQCKHHFRMMKIMKIMHDDADLVSFS